MLIFTFPIKLITKSSLKLFLFNAISLNAFQRICGFLSGNNEPICVIENLLSKGISFFI